MSEFKAIIFLFISVPKKIIKKIREDEEYPSFFCGKKRKKDKENGTDSSVIVAPALPIQPSTIVVPTTGKLCNGKLTHQCCKY